MSSAGPRVANAVVERMAPRDLDRVVEIERLSYRAPWEPQVFIEELTRECAYLDVLRDRPGSTARAFVNFWLVRDEVHLLNLAVHPDARGHGAASHLLEHVVAFAWSQGCRYVTLEVRRSNDVAMRLYRKFGFRPVGIRPDYYVEDREDAVVMLLEKPSAG